MLLKSCFLYYTLLLQKEQSYLTTKKQIQNVGFYFFKYYHLSLLAKYMLVYNNIIS